MSSDRELLEEIQRVVDGSNPSLDPLAPEEAVQMFLDEERSELAPNTLSEYEDELERFVKFCEKQDTADTTEFNGRLLQKFKIWRRDEANEKDGSLSNKTMRDEMYLLRKFIRFLESIDAAPQHLHTKIKIPTLNPGEGKRDIEFTADELDAILTHLEKFKYASREHVVWILFAATGRRPSGLRSLDCSDVHFTENETYMKFNHREGETRLKNGNKSENTVYLNDEAAQVVQDYIDTQRIDVEVNGRSPLLTSTTGRLSDASIRKYIYKWSRPCVIGKECPVGRDPEGCEAMESGGSASKCPESKPPVALRHGYISDLLRRGVSLHTISDRCDVSEEIIRENYSELSETEQRNLRRKELEKQSDSTDGYF
jgi:site-specific recombinase XerD